MSATYDELLEDDVSRIRVQLGDHTFEAPEDALLSDEHIEAVLAWKGGITAALAFLAEELLARFGQEPDSVRLPSGLSVSFTSRIPVWTRLAGRMQAQLAEAAEVYGPATTGDTANQAVW